MKVLDNACRSFAGLYFLLTALFLSGTQIITIAQQTVLFQNGIAIILDVVYNQKLSLYIYSLLDLWQIPDRRVHYTISGCLSLSRI